VDVAHFADVAVLAPPSRPLRLLLLHCCCAVSAFCQVVGVGGGTGFCTRGLVRSVDDILACPVSDQLLLLLLLLLLHTCRAVYAFWSGG
jgi:hypothetical protein